MVASSYGGAHAGVVNGSDLAFVSMLVLSPDFAAANYTIESNETVDAVDVDIAVTRFPFLIDLKKTAKTQLQLEVALAYLRTKETFPFGLPGETITTRLVTYGAGLGLLYKYALTDRLQFAPSLRLGISNLTTSASFSDGLTPADQNVIKEAFEQTSNASVLNLGLGLIYNWELGGRPSSIQADVFHTIVDSFDEADNAPKFTESANMLALRADMIFPTDVAINGGHLDYVLLVGSNHFFGDNRDTLGYTTSYQAGIGAEVPLRWHQEQYGYLRFSGEVIFGDGVDGWLLSASYTPLSKEYNAARFAVSVTLYFFRNFQT
jgi:hypothetical protein